jgi:hypothetical protein
MMCTSFKQEQVKIVPTTTDKIDFMSVWNCGSCPSDKAQILSANLNYEGNRLHGLLNLRFSWQWNEDYHLLGWDTLQSARSLATFRNSALPPSSGSKSKPSKQQASSSSLGNFSTLKLETVCSFKPSVNFYQTIWHHIWNDSTFHSFDGIMQSFQF